MALAGAGAGEFVASLRVSAFVPSMLNQKAWEPSVKVEIASRNVEMSASAEASELLKRLAEPAPVGAHVETLIRDVALKMRMPFRRAKALWYREAARVDSEEMDALRAAARAREEAEGALRREYQDVISRIENLERRLDAPHPKYRGA